MAKCWVRPLFFVLNVTLTILTRLLMHEIVRHDNDSWANLEIELINPCTPLHGIENTHLTMKAIVMVKLRNKRNLS